MKNSFREIDEEDQGIYQNAKGVELALRSNEERFRALVEHLPAIVFMDMVDDAETTIYISPKIESALGYTPEEWDKEISWTDSLHPDDRERVLAEDKRTNDTGEPFRMEYRLRTKSGQYIWVREEADLIKSEDGTPKFWQGFLHDITERKQAEEAIRQNEEQFKKIFQANPIPSYIATLKEGCFIAANDAYWKLSGFEPNEFLGHTSIELGFVTPANRKKLVSRLKKEKSLHNESGILFTKSGETRNTLEFFDLISFDGQDCILSMFYDKTDQVKAQAALQENEEKYRQLFEAESDAIFLIDNESGNILEANAAASAMYGYSKAELLRKKNSDLSAEPEETRRVTKKTPIHRDRVISIPLRYHKKKDGTIFPVEITGRFFKWRGRPVHIAAIRDITNRKNAEEELRSIAEFRQATIERVTEGLCVCHSVPDFPYVRFTVWNDRMTEITGYTIDQINKNGWYQSVYPDPDIQKAAIARMDQMREGEDLIAEEWEITRADGEKRVLNISTTILKINEDESHVLALMQDVTEQKRSKEALERQLKELTILHNVALSTSSSNSIDELIQRITDTIGDTLYPDNCGVELLTESGDMLVPHPSYRGATGDTTRWRLHISQGVTGKVASTGTPIRLGDVSQEPAYIEATAGVQSELCVPVKIQDRVIGVINVESKKTNAFSEADERLLNTVAGTMATAIEHLRLFETSQRRLQELTILNTVGLASTEAGSVDELIEQITKIIGESLYPDNFGVLLLNEDGNALYPHPSYRGITHGKFPTSIPLEQGVSGQVATTGIPLRISNVRNHPKYIEVTSQVRSELCVSIAHGDRILGVINAESLKIDAFTKDDERLLSTIASTLATAIEKLRLFEVEQQRREDAEILRQTAEAVTSSLDVRQVLDAILNNLSRVVPFDSSALFLLEGDKVRLTAGIGLPNNEKVVGSLFAANNALLQEVWDTGKPLILEDAQADPRFEKWAAADHVRGWMGIPLTARGMMIGCITIDSYKPGAYSERDATMAMTFAHQAAAAIENARLYERSEQQIHQLTALRDIDSAISSSFDLRVMLDFIASHAVKELKVDAAVILLYNPDLEALSLYTKTGFTIEGTPYSSYVRIGEGLGGKVALNRKPVQILDLSNSPEYETGALVEDGFKSYFGIPLIGKGQVRGVLEVYSRTEINPTSDWFNFLHTLAGQAAIAIDNVELFKNLHRSNLELTLAYDTTLAGWGRALELRDKETQGHTNRVVKLTVELARRMGVAGEDLTRIMRGTFLHDIGKMGIPDSILNKPGPLTEEEWVLMQQHPQFAYDLINPIPYLRSAIEIPYGHHERWDGSGYPLGLKGEAIPLAARIFAVVDVYDALLNDRVYREAWPEEKVIEYLKNAAGIELDPAIVEKFLEIIREDHYKNQAE